MDTELESQYEDVQELARTYDQHDGTPPLSTESVFSMNWRMVDPSGCEVQMTLRAGATREIIAEVTGLRRTLLDSAQKAGWTFPGGSRPAPVSAPPTNGTGTPPPAAAGPSTAWVLPPPTGTVPQQVAGGGFASKPRESFVARRMEIEAHPSGKINVNFMEAGHRYPDLKATKTVPDAITMLSKTGAWNAEHLQPGKGYDVEYLVEYTLGKPNSQGRPYKDLADVRPMPAEGER